MRGLWTPRGGHNPCAVAITPRYIGAVHDTGSVHPPYVAVVGPSEPDHPSVTGAAREAGRLLAERGVVVVTGGLGGVMAAAAAGADQAGGTTVALLPGTRREDASLGHTVVLPTGLGEMRNALVVRSVDAVLAVGAGWGTLSEIALAARAGVPVAAVQSWDLPEPGVVSCATAAEAVAVLLERLGR
jgi:uncharacterized protein (TIGR00725 family)